MFYWYYYSSFGNIGALSSLQTDILPRIIALVFEINVTKYNMVVLKWNNG